MPGGKRGQGLNRRGGGGSTGKFIFEPFGEWNSMVLYNYFTWAPCCCLLPPRGTPCRGGEGAARVSEGEGGQVHSGMTQGVLLPRPS